MSLIERFSGNIYGGITFIGNSLMVSERKDARPLSELSDSCSFISTDTKKKFKDFPEGTCENFEDNSSEAPLLLPRDAYVVYSELIWGGTYKTEGGGIPEEILDSKIKFTLPDTNLQEIEPDFATSQSSRFVSADVYCYTRSAVVTDLVRKAGSGFYTVGAVPSYFAPGDNLSQIFASAGWTLAVIFRRRDTKVPLKNISFYVGNLPLNESESKTVNIKGFSTPKETEPKASLLISACCGDVSEKENSVAFSHDESEDFIPICGPNNLRTHFFASQINNSNGFLETGGTFGKYNHFLVGSEYVGSDCGRQGWDITETDISHLIKNEKQSGIIKFSSVDDRFLVNATAICIDTYGEESDFSDDSFAAKTIIPSSEEIKTFRAPNFSSTNSEETQVSEISVNENPSENLIDNKDKVEIKEEGITAKNFAPQLVNPLGASLQSKPLSVSPKILTTDGISNNTAPQNCPSCQAASGSNFTVRTTSGLNPTCRTTNGINTSCQTTSQQTPQSELYSQALIERLYTYNINEISNYSIRYDSARVVNFGSIPVLTAGYTLSLCYIDACGKPQTSVKRGSVSFMDISMSMVNSCTIRIFPSSAFIDGNEVVFRACVKVYTI